MKDFNCELITIRCRGDFDEGRHVVHVNAEVCLLTTLTFALLMELFWARWTSEMGWLHAIDSEAIADCRDYGRSRFRHLRGQLGRWECVVRRDHKRMRLIVPPDNLELGPDILGLPPSLLPVRIADRLRRAHQNSACKTILDLARR